MGHVPCTHDGTDMPACTPDLRHAHRLTQEVREAWWHGGDLHGACLNAHGTMSWTGAGNEHGIMPRASPFRRIEELSSQKPAKSYEQSGTKRDRRAAWVQPTYNYYILIFVDLPCRSAQLRGRLGSALLTCEWDGSCEVARGHRMGLWAYASSLNTPCPQDIAPITGRATILMASRTDFPDIVPTLRSTPLSYHMSHDEYSVKEITTLRPL